MNKKRMIALLFTAMLCIMVFPVTAFAGGEDTEEPTPPPSIINPNPQPLTPDGNLTLVDDIEGEQAEDKQFITVVTKNGNYFYIIVDRAGDTDNVYFLNMVDETDLLALIEEMEDAPPTQTVVTPAARTAAAADHHRAGTRPGAGKEKRRYGRYTGNRPYPCSGRRRILLF